MGSDGNHYRGVTSDTARMRPANAQCRIFRFLNLSYDMVIRLVGRFKSQDWIIQTSRSFP